MADIPLVQVPYPEEETRTLYGYITNDNAPPKYDDIMDSNLTKEQKVKAIQDRTNAYKSDVDRQLHKDYARMGAGTALSMASALPLRFLPSWAGAAAGGAMYDLGQGIVEGDTAPDLLKRTTRGALVGGTIGLVPYAANTPLGKMVAESKPGQAVGSALNKAGEKFANTKLYDALMTDIIPNTNRQPTYYHGTKAVFDNFSPEFIGTAHDPGIYGKGFYFTPSKNLAQSYAQSARNGETPRIIAANLEMKNPLNMTDFNSAEDIAKYLDMEENIRDFIPAEYGNKTIYRPNGFLQNTGKFQSRVMDLGHDGVIVGNNEVVVFNPNQIHQIENIKQPNLFEQLAGKQNTGAVSDSLYNRLTNDFPSIEHYNNPQSDFKLLDLNPNSLNELNKPNKPIIIKQNIVGKNKNNHPEVDINDYNDILNNALYNPNYILQVQPNKRPNYYTFVNKNRYDTSVLDMDNNKSNYEVVNWFRVNNKRLQDYIKRTKNEGGDFLIND